MKCREAPEKTPTEAVQVYIKEGTPKGVKGDKMDFKVFNQQMLQYTVTFKIDRHDVELDYNLLNAENTVKVWYSYNSNFTCTDFMYDFSDNKFKAFSNSNLLTARQEKLLKKAIKKSYMLVLNEIYYNVLKLQEYMIPSDWKMEIYEKYRKKIDKIIY